MHRAHGAQDSEDIHVTRFNRARSVAPFAALATLVSAPAPAPAAQSQVTNTAFNPAIGVILDGKYGSFSQDPDTYALPGFTLGEETGPGEEGLSLGESELNITGNVDNYFYAQLTAAITPENKVEVEEAFFETLAMPYGLTIKAGRFFSGMGYLNPVHAHAWDFVDQPLVYRAMLGNQYGDDGVQLRWVAPVESVLIEAGGELFRGEAFPAGGAARNGKGTSAGFIRAGGDIGASWAWRVGVSRLDARAEDRATGDETTPDIFTGRSTITGADFVAKWAPQGNTTHQNFKFNAEYFVRDAEGNFDPASSGVPIDYTGDASGWYAQAVYQFIPQWRAGLRYDRLEADPVDAALAGTVLDAMEYRPSRASAMIDWSHSEFSRVRFQYNRDESRMHQPDNQWYVQYLMSIGAHGAHQF